MFLKLCVRRWEKEEEEEGAQAASRLRGKSSIRLGTRGWRRLKACAVAATARALRGCLQPATCSVRSPQPAAPPAPPPGARHAGQDVRRQGEGPQAAGIHPQDTRDRDAGDDDAGGAAGAGRRARRLPPAVWGRGHAGPRRLPGLPHHHARAAAGLPHRRDRPPAQEDGVYVQRVRRAASAGGGRRGGGLLAHRGPGADDGGPRALGARARGAVRPGGQRARLGPLPGLPGAAVRAALPHRRLLRLPHGALRLARLTTPTALSATTAADATHQTSTLYERILQQIHTTNLFTCKINV